jgi:hypothetical protein
MKISRALVQRYLISYSCSCTALPGRLPRTGKGLVWVHKAGTGEEKPLRSDRGAGMGDGR